MMRAYLVGRPPDRDLGFSYVAAPDYEGVVIGSLTLSQLLCFCEPVTLQALAEGKPVVLYTPGLPETPKNRALAASLASARRQLKSWGVVFTDGGQKRLITAEEARRMKQSGQIPGPGAVMTPLAREILEGSS
ncbi:MAG: hypothetical protein IIX23_05020 [Oscillospiraceae bacterium]|nr:hypothetical protein [Oscillospiraceae bacterium]